MKKFGIFIFCALLAVGCRQKIVPADMSKINGYWEIERVDLPEADHKEYRINETFDYFEIKNNVGFRKKVMPQLNGTFLVNDAFETVKVLFKDDKVILEFKTRFSTMREELIELTAEKLVLKNKQNVEYQYKKAAAIDFTKDNEKNK